MREPDRLRPAQDRTAPIRDPGKAVAPPRVLPLAAHPDDGTPGRSAQQAGGRGWRGLALTGGALALLWGGLTGWDPAGWVFGLPAVAAATALAFRFPPGPAWRLSLPGALRFAGWFALASVRGSLDVAARALAWRMPLAPGFRSYRTDLPPGPARLVFVNAITLLPGTLSAEIAGPRVEVHMLDTGLDLDAELAPLEARVRDLFALPASPARTLDDQPDQRETA